MQASNYNQPDALKVLIAAGADVHRAANVRATRVPPLVTRRVSTNLHSHVLSRPLTCRHNSRHNSLGGASAHSAEEIGRDDPFLGT